MEARKQGGMEEDTSNPMRLSASRDQRFLLFYRNKNSVWQNTILFYLNSLNKYFENIAQNTALPVFFLTKF